MFLIHYKWWVPASFPIGNVMYVFPLVMLIFLFCFYIFLALFFIFLQLRLLIFLSYSFELVFTVIYQDYFYIFSFWLVSNPDGKFIFLLLHLASLNEPAPFICLNFLSFILRLNVPVLTWFIFVFCIHFPIHLSIFPLIHIRLSIHPPNPPSVHPSSIHWLSLVVGDFEIVL